ncbi:MAG: AtpZ/AtpI family protein [Bacteroidetes bacterium]|jgi:ATP synthase protein I|nr:AtpZ/AtpI family protein [Bacteroidota bacterium]
MKESNDDLKKKTAGIMNAYAKYSSMAFQMIFIILAGVYGGILLDKLTGWQFPVFKLSLSLISVILAVYYSIKDFLKKS